MPFPADASRFRKGFEGFVRFVANVADVDPAVTSGNAGQRDHLFRGGWLSYFVFQSGRKTKRSFAHGLLDHLLHLLDLGVGRVTIGACPITLERNVAWPTKVKTL